MCCHSKETNLQAVFLHFLSALLLLYAVKLWGRIPSTLFNLQEQTHSAPNLQQLKQTMSMLFIFITDQLCHFFLGLGDDFAFHC